MKPSRVRKIKKQMKKFLGVYSNSFNEKMGQEKSEVVKNDCMEELIAKIDDIPDIGGKKNAFQGTIDFAFVIKIIYKRLQRENLKTEEIGEIFFEGFKTFVDKYPNFIMKIMKKKQFSKKHIEYMKNQAKEAKNRDCKYDWGFEVVHGVEGEFEWGIDYHKCGINEYFRENGIKEILPYICATDFCMFSKMKMDLGVTKTLGVGDEICDFRFKKNGVCIASLDNPEIVMLLERSKKAVK